MGKFVLPDEDTWVLPDAWRQALHPRRGGHPAPERVPAPEAAEKIREWLRSDLLPAILARASERDMVFDPGLLAEGERYLRSWQGPDDPGDDANPLGAAVAILLVGGCLEGPPDVANLWVSRHGIEFSARLVGELARLLVDGSLWSIAPAPHRTYESLWRGSDRACLFPVARTLRIRLATATDAEYARACEILGGYRTSPLGRMVTSYLVPTQLAWVDEDCAAAAGWMAVPEGEDGTRDHHLYLSQMLLLAAGTLSHLELLRDNITSMLLWGKSDEAMSTVLDGVGLAAAPVLAEPFYLKLLDLNYGKWEFRGQLGPDAIRMLSLTPTDEAFRLLCRQTIGLSNVRPGALLKSGALSRYPVRALRILSELEAAEPVYRQWGDEQLAANPYETALYRDLLGTLVLTNPRLLSAASLPETVRARAQEILDSGGAGIGAGWAGLLDKNSPVFWEHNLRIDTADDEKRVVTALAAIPTEEAFGHLVDRAERRYVRPVLLNAAKRDRRLALRVLLAKSADHARSDAATTVSELLRNHVLAYPEAVAEALPELDPAARAHLAAIVASAEQAGADATAGATLPVLTGSPHRPDGQPIRVPELPDWLVIATLPAVSLRAGGDVLSQDAVRRLCALVAVSKITAPHPGIAEVRAACEPHTLSALAWTVFEQWQAAQYPAKNKFAMVALALLGDDSVVPALTSLFPSWGQASMRVRTGMEVLAAIGSDGALMHLHRLTRQAKTKGLRQFAQARLDDVAVARGLHPAQLADRIVADLGLDSTGRTPLDYGPRKFTVGFDERLQPYVIDQDGGRLARLPRPAAADDATLAPAAHRRFTAMKKDVKNIVAERLRALEEAMVVERRWTAEEFERLFVAHPLTWQLTRRLLWGAFDERGAAVTAFRVAEDRTLADIDDKAFALDGTATVGVAHPWHFANDRAAWTALFDDYAIVQPFAQLARELIGRSEAEETLTSPGSFADKSVASRKLFTLTARGWRFSDDYDALLRDWPGNRTVAIRYSPGYHWQEPDQDVHLTGVQVWTTSMPPEGPAWSRRPRAEDTADFADLSPITISETVRDLRFLIR